MKHVKHIEELDFTIVAKPNGSGLTVDFDIYDIGAWDKDGKPYWTNKNSVQFFEPTDKLELAALFAHGEVKWDGCSNWYFDEQDSCMLHGCSRERILRFGEILARCWDWAAELCPKWNP